MHKHNFPSIEQFAAFLDGNLSHDEMSHFAQIAKNDKTLHQMLDTNSVIEDTIAGFSEEEKQIPEEISGTSFEIPMTHTNGVSDYMPLKSEYINDLFSTAVCEDDNTSLYSDNPVTDILIDNTNNHDNHSDFVQTSENLENDDLSNMLSDDM